MNEIGVPRHLLVWAGGSDSPLRTTGAGFHAVAPHDFTINVPTDEPGLDLPSRLVRDLDSWNANVPPAGTSTKAEIRNHTKIGLSLAHSVARHLGPAWAVRFWDARHGSAKFICWGCSRLHWTPESHGNPPHPLHLTVMAEYKWGPLRAEGFGDFMPDDPAAGLSLPDDLVDDLYAWARDFDTEINQYLKERDEGKHGERRRELDRRGEELTDRVARALGPGRTVTYAGLA